MLPASIAMLRAVPTRSEETSEAITRPCGPTRSKAPNAISPSPDPTSSSPSPGRRRALSSTRFRIGRRCSRALAHCSGSSPSRRCNSHDAHLSRSGSSTTWERITGRISGGRSLARGRYVDTPSLPALLHRVCRPSISGSGTLVRSTSDPSSTRVMNVPEITKPGSCPKSPWTSIPSTGAP